MGTELCKDCQEYFNGITLQLEKWAEKSKRGNLILDALNDVCRSVNDGNINAVKQRDKLRQEGKKVPRRLNKK